MTDFVTRPIVLVVGGGFGGLHAAKGLSRTDVEVAVVDRQNHHLFQPLLYQVASAVLSPADIAQPIRRILRHQSNARVVLGEVDGIDLEHRTVSINGIEAHYDYLVLAAGATHSYFGRNDWAALAPGLKSVRDALEIRRRVLLAFEAAELETDPEARRARLTFVVIGGGPTGVELAGALKEIAVDSLRADFRNIDTSTARVILVEGQSRLLPGMAPKSSARALKDLEHMGVEVRLSARVTDITREAVFIGEDRLETSSVFWAAGVQASPLAKALGVELDRAGRVIVNSDCSVPGHPEVFVVGDMALLVDDKRGGPVPGVAQGAMQMGEFVARIIHREVSSSGPQPRPAFHFQDKGSMATVGRGRAVADVWGMNFSGFIAWVLWSVIHVLFLIGLKSKIFVMLSWAWNYLVWSKGARLITGNVAITVKSPRLLPQRDRSPSASGSTRPSEPDRSDAKSVAWDEAEVGS